MAATTSNVQPDQWAVEENGAGCVVLITMKSGESGTRPIEVIVPITRERKRSQCRIGLLFVIISFAVGVLLRGSDLVCRLNFRCCGTPKSFNF